MKGRFQFSIIRTTSEQCKYLLKWSRAILSPLPLMTRDSINFKLFSRISPLRCFKIMWCQVLSGMPYGISVLVDFGDWNFIFALRKWIFIESFTRKNKLFGVDIDRYYRFQGLILFWPLTADLAYIIVHIPTWLRISWWKVNCIKFLKFQFKVF